ncbi:prepilin-type N-terminal cleavage/methylation domain-containing protein [Alphaproteobacteria bacterium]|nr:prepilin-type N-terminal cleavage/methylation domain-containing protein [Alphaproteobacteria bacterium]
MKNTKGFSLIEFLVVVALIGLMSLFFFQPQKSRWNKEIGTAYSDILSLMKYYQKKAMRDGVMYFFEFDYNSASATLFIEPSVNPVVTNRRTTCTPIKNSSFEGRRVLSSAKGDAGVQNIRVIGCGQSGCKNANVMTGICFYPNGSSNSYEGHTDWQISLTKGNSSDHAMNSYKIKIWPTTSYMETFICKGSSRYTSITSTTDACTNASKWIEQ